MGRADGTGGGGVRPFLPDPRFGDVSLLGILEFSAGVDSPVEIGVLSGTLSSVKCCFCGDFGVSNLNDGGDFGGENVL